MYREVPMPNPPVSARAIMSSPVVTVPLGTSLESAARLMLGRRIGCLPVCDAHGRLAGILTESDFAAKEHGVPFSLYRFPQLFGEWLEADGVERMYAAARQRPVEEVMTRAVVSVVPEDDLETVVRTMLRSGYHRLLVVEGGKPVGVIARHDLLRLMLPPES